MAPLIKAWIMAARPKTLPFGAAPVFVGSALASHAGNFSWKIFFICLASAILMQVGANYANDLFDHKNGADTPQRIGPVRVVAAGLLSAKHMFMGMSLVFFAAFIIASPIIFEGGWPLGVLFAVLVTIAIGYSGGPYPLAYHGLGEITNLIFMAAIPTLVMYYVQTKSIITIPLYIGLSFGGLTSAVMCMNNLRDEITDRENGKGTLVARYGARFGKGLFAFLVIYPMILPILFVLFMGMPFGLCGVSALILPAIPILRATFSANTPQEFSAVFPKTAVLALVYMLTFSYGLIL